MKNKEYFYRDNWKEYEPKYLLLCNKCEFKVNTFGNVKKNDYLCRIKILSNE